MYKVRGRLSTRMSANGNAWIECWRTVRPVPAHKQKSLFDYEKEAERALHDLEVMSPSAVLGQLLNCNIYDLEMKSPSYSRPTAR